MNKEFEKILNTFAILLADRMADLINGNMARVEKKGKILPFKIKIDGRKKPRHIDMQCRVAHCKNRSKGPRFLFMCETHLEKLTKPQQRKALKVWHEKHDMKAAA